MAGLRMKREIYLSLRAVLEGDIHPRAVRDDLPFVDRHVQFDDLGDPQVLEGFPGDLS